jgi:predicted TIM-barrel fold metal-dependent hydrolase
VYLDTSWPPGLVSVAPEIVRDVVRRHGADRIVFGSDWPMSDPEQDVDTLRRIGLTDEEVHMILGGNMANLLGLSSP